MVDRWSSAAATFNEPGDWAVWSFDIADSTTRDVFNNLVSGNPARLTIRAAFLEIDVEGHFALIINELIAHNFSGANVYTTDSTSASWDTDDRFHGAVPLEGLGSTGFVNSIDGNGTLVLPAVEAHVVGTNTYRIVWLGGGSPAPYAALNYEVDYIQIQYDGSASGAFGVYGPGVDSVSEAKPSDFDTHVNPNPTVADVAPRHVYLLKGNEATLGHAALATFTLTKFCPAGDNYRVGVTLAVDGSPVVGAAIHRSDDLDTTVNTNSRGEAIFVIPIVDTSSTGPYFWFAGTDDVAPAYVEWNYATQPFIGCGGWHVGRIGVG